MKFLTALGEALLLFALFVLFAVPFFVLNHMNANIASQAPIAQASK